MLTALISEEELYNEYHSQGMSQIQEIKTTLEIDVFKDSFLKNCV